MSDRVVPGNQHPLASGSQSGPDPALADGLSPAAGSTTGAGPDVDAATDAVSASGRGSESGEGSATFGAVAGAVEGQLDARPWLRLMLRAGWVAKAVVYGSMAWIALLVGLDVPTESDASYTGAIEELAARPLSRFSLLLLAAGLLLYCGYRFASVLLIRDTELDDWAHRVGYTFSGATYLVVAWLAAEVALSDVTSDSESLVETLSTRLLGDGLGRLLVGLGGVGAIAVALYFGTKGLTRRFATHLDLSEASPIQRRVVEFTGAVGWFGRCLIVGVVGLFVTWSAIDADPVDARGLDRSLQRLAGDDLGVFLVIGIAVLLFAYALFCLVSIPYRRL